MTINCKQIASIIAIVAFSLTSKISNGQEIGYNDKLGVFRFNSYSNMVDSIFSYVANTSPNGSYVFAFETKKGCLSNKTKHYIKQLYSSYELTTLKKDLIKSQEVKTQQVKSLKLIEISEDQLKTLQLISYSDFISKYVNLSNGVLYRIDNDKELNAVLYILLSYNISIYVTDNSGDYIISID